LTAARHVDCLVVACDMPFLSRPLLTFMAEMPRSAYDVLVPVTSARPGSTALDRLYQPLHSIYRRTCRLAITAQLDAGERRVTSFYRNVRVQCITAPQASRYDPEHQSFFSINTPEALHEARRRLAGSSPTG
jgi:molybdopterin-guanine dinucleotide biosynthesis protein A